jgi:hypothetical protein
VKTISRFGRKLTACFTRFDGPYEKSYFLSFPNNSLRFSPRSRFRNLPPFSKPVLTSRTIIKLTKLAPCIHTQLAKLHPNLGERFDFGVVKKPRNGKYSEFENDSTNKSQFLST